MNNKNNNNYNTKNTLTNKILSIFSSTPKKVFNYKQISSILHLQNNNERQEVNSILFNLEKSGTIKQVKKGRYQLITKTGVIFGRIDVNKRGVASLICEDINEEIVVNNRNLKTALHGDKVKAVLYAQKIKSRLEAEVISVTERFRIEFAGIIEISPTYAFFMPDDQRIPYDVFIPTKKTLNAEAGDKVLVEITDWNAKGKNPLGKVVKVLGKPGDNNAEMHSILSEFALPSDFPKSVIKSANSISDKIPKNEIKVRKDLRTTTTFTIDPYDAKDFDDAISFNKIDDNTFEIGVHIADVSYYVTKDSIVDQEARKRTTSVYLVDRVIPMLPENLSNNICSLKPNEDKLCFSVIFKMDLNANIIDTWTGKTIIHSDYRLDYQEAQNILDTGEGNLSYELKTVNDLAKNLRKQRFVKGAFNFEHPEVKFTLDENGKPLGVYFKETLEANNLIEEFMLLSNKHVAKLVSQSKHQMVYRIHDEPNPEKIYAFSGFIKKFGHKINPKDSDNLSSSLNSLIKDIKGKPEQSVIETLAIRTMAKAEYSTQNIGHYGLAFKFYTHFTSPIRRYPDLLVHRILLAFLNNEKPYQDDLEWLCKTCSELEIRAVKAERASIKYKQAEFLSDKIGEIFNGKISGVTEWGFFVELEENACEGLVPMRTLLNDFYYYDEENFRIIGKTTKEVFSLGDFVKVQIANVNLIKKQIDFELISKL